MNLQDIKETKRYGRTDTGMDACTDNSEKSIPTTNKVCGVGIKTKFAGGIIIRNIHVILFQNLHQCFRCCLKKKITDKGQRLITVTIAHPVS